MKDTPNRLVVLCGCSCSDVISEDVKQQVRAGLRAGDVNLREVDDLCELAAGDDPVLAEIAAAESLTVVACYPRTVQWLFHRAGLTPADKGMRVLNMREQGAGDILASLDCEPAGAAPGEHGDHPWVPWFPVLDYSRCTNCGQCLDFCLFGVYERAADGSVQVTNPGNCKNNCPACARICPQVAIIFPKVPELPINGADVTAETVQAGNVALNIDEALGHDLYAALGARRKRAKTALLKRKALKQAIAEREACAGEKDQA
jgi:NAD-dependent dihydropyrimidine dehydrogenase PreA subunit